MRRMMVCIGCALAIGACDKAPEPEATTERPTKIAGEEVPTEREVKEAAKDAGPEDCATYFKEVRQVCLDHYERGLKINCHMEVTKATTTLSQLDGKLFKDPNGNHTEREIGHTICASNVKSLRKKVAKAETMAVTLDDDCKAFVKALDASCFVPVSKGEAPKNGCTGALVASGRWDERGQKMCKPLLGTF